MNKKTFMLIYFETFLLIAVSCLALNNYFPVEHHNPVVHGNLMIFIERPRANGVLASSMSFQLGNQITAIGEQYVRNIIGFNNASSQAPVNWITWGNSTVDATKTQLDTEATTANFNRSNTITAVPWYNVDDFAFNITISIIANATININACGAQWSGTLSSNNNLFALALLPQATTANIGDNFTAVWSFTFEFTD